MYCEIFTNGIFVLQTKIGIWNELFPFPLQALPTAHDLNAFDSSGAMPASLSASAGNSRPVQCLIGSRDCPILVIHYVSRKSRTLVSSLNRAYNIPELSVGPISTTQPTPTHRKVNILDPQTMKPTQPTTHNPTELHITNNMAFDWYRPR